MSLYAAEALERETTVAGVLTTTCVQLIDVLEAEACTLSRVIGQLLIGLVEHTRDGRGVQLGRGYLVPDFPLTQEVIELEEPRTVWLPDPEVDASEAALLRELGFDSLLMLPLSVDGGVWGLVEVYRLGTRAFDAADVATGAAIVQLASDGIVRVRRRAAAA